MSYTYDILCILKNPRTYIEEEITSPSFKDAVFTIITERKILSRVFSIYARRNTTGDLKYMGKYDGMSVIVFRGIRFTHILRTSQEKDYSYFPDGFRQICIR